MLVRLRRGEGLSGSDMKLLAQRTLRDPSKADSKDWNERLGLHASFADAPVICANNDQRAQINIERTRAYARNTKKVLLWSPARDTMGKGKGASWLKARGKELVEQDKWTWLTHNDRRCAFLSEDARTVSVLDGCRVVLHVCLYMIVFHRFSSAH
eukprot:gene12927-biopygen12931